MNRSDLAAALAVGLVTAVALVGAYDLRHADLRIPLHYEAARDTLAYEASFKTFLETGGGHLNPRLGAPGVADLYDVPVPQASYYLLVRAAVGLTGDAPAAMNLVHFLGFFLSAWSCLLVLRVLGVGTPAAAAGGLLFAFLPAHFWRGTCHLDLAFYPTIPLGALLCVWLCEGVPLFVPGPGGDADAPARPTLRRAAAVVVICGLTATSQIYYAFFTGLLLVAAGALAWLRRPRPAPPWDAVICVVIFLGFVAAEAVPYVSHFREHGVKGQVVKRAPGYSQQLAVPVSELLLPTLGHRVPKLRLVEARRSIGLGADPRDPKIGARVVINEKYYNALGVVGSAGFLLLWAALLAVPAVWAERLRPLPSLGRLNAVAVLVGADLTLLLEVALPLIRAYNRIAVFIAFFALAAAALAADRFRPAADAPRGRRLAYLGVLGAVCLLGLLDQTPSVVTPDYPAVAARRAAEARYVRDVESRLPAGARVFQLPYSESFESVHLSEAFRPYLHSRHLTWSFGASRGSEADAFQRDAADRPVEGLLAALRSRGFAGVHVDRELLTGKTRLATDRPSLVDDLTRLLGPPTVVGLDGRWLFFPLSPATPG